jgi:hypothetical protein
MNFGLLVLRLPHGQESRHHHDPMLSPTSTRRHRCAAFWRAFKNLIS